MWTAKLAIGYENDSVDGKRLMPFWGKNAEIGKREFYKKSVTPLPLF